MNSLDLTPRQILSGEQAFYRQSNYEIVTKDEMSSPSCLKKPIYKYNTETKAWRIFKDVLSTVIFPIGLFRLIHFIAGKIIVPASAPKMLGYDPGHANDRRNTINLNSQWKVKRIAIEADGYMIDAVLMGKAATLGNGRWFLASNGNAAFYEDKLHERTFKKLLAELNGNAIVFNYPGVGASSGMPSRSAMTKAYCAILKFLEDQEKGIGAKEIIGYGHSIGGGVQGDALLLHQLKPDIKYCFVKSRTFSDLSKVAADITKGLGFLVHLVGWNMSSVKSSRSLQAPEIIIQSAKVSVYTDISDQSKIIKHDGVISAKASLAKKLLDDKTHFIGKKCFIGIPEKHNTDFYDLSYIADHINKILISGKQPMPWMVEGVLEKEHKAVRFGEARARVFDDTQSPEEVGKLNSVVLAPAPTSHQFADFQMAWPESNTLYPKLVKDRRFPPLSSYDTVIFKDDCFRSVHPEGVKFYKDTEILMLHPSIRKIDLGDNIQADMTDNGKIVIQQQATRGCTAAVAAMLIHDAQKPINLASLYSTNLGNTEKIMCWISEAGLTPRLTELDLKSCPNELISDLQKLIQDHGPAIVSTDNDIGGHVIVVDSVSESSNCVRLRDPYHGWAITITKEAFLRGFKGGHLIQAEKVEANECLF